LSVLAGIQNTNLAPSAKVDLQVEGSRLTGAATTLLIYNQTAG